MRNEKGSHFVNFNYKNMCLIPLESLATPVHGSSCIFDKFLILKTQEVIKETVPLFRYGDRELVGTRISGSAVATSARANSSKTASTPVTWPSLFAATVFIYTVEIIWHCHLWVRLIYLHTYSCWEVIHNIASGEQLNFQKAVELSLYLILLI